VKINSKEIGCEIVDWITLAQDTVRWLAFVNAVMSLRIQ